jgi:hypothetical protein
LKEHSGGFSGLKKKQSFDNFKFWNCDDGG